MQADQTGMVIKGSPRAARLPDRGGSVANEGVNDAMFCEACGAHRDRLGAAGKTIYGCPDCGRATCANCWNQVAGGCLACHAFTLSNVAPPIVRPRAMPPWSVAPGTVEAATTPDPTPTRRADRFGHIRPGRVVRATVLGSALAISVAAVGYAGVLRPAPNHGANTSTPIGTPAVAPTERPD